MVRKKGFAVTHGVTNSKMEDVLQGDFKTWMKEVDRLFLKRTCCDWADLCGDDEPVQEAFKDKETPKQFVDRICEKYDLGEENPWGGAAP